MLDATLTPPPKIDGDRTRQAILRSAQALFVEHGFTATSMATVAKQAGVTKSLIHHHFGSKRELWDAVRSVVMDEYQRKQQEMLRERAPDLSLVEDSLVVYFRFLQENPDVTRLWNWMVIEGDAQCASMSQELTSAGVSTLRAAQENGSMRTDVDPEYVIAQFFALVRGWFSERAIMQASVLQGLPDATCDERYLRATMKVFIDGLRPR
jgi:TetR/AcrR family transcriptional regulator